MHPVLLHALTACLTSRALVTLCSQETIFFREYKKYRQLANFSPASLKMDFVPAIASTSGRIHSELLRLLFLHAHRETTRFFEIFDDKHAQPHTSRFTYRRAAFFNTLKSKTGLERRQTGGRPLATD